LIENSGNIEITFDFASVDFQQNVARLDSGMFCRSVLCNALRLYKTSTILNPGATIFRSDPLPFLMRIKPTKDKQSNREQRDRNKSEGNDFPVIRNGY